MIDSIDSPTFVFDHISHKDNFALFDYFDTEGININYCTFTELLSTSNVYYPVKIESTNIDFGAIISSVALSLARKHKLVIVFIHDNSENIITNAYRIFMRQQSILEISIKDVRFVTNDFTVATHPIFIYFPFSELHFRTISNQINTKIEPNLKSKKFMYTPPIDSGHARLFGASLWYHALPDQGYFKYPAINKLSNFNTIRKWNNVWSSTGTLMDMFGLHLPLDNITLPPNKTVYDDSFWNFVPEKNFVGPTLITTQIFVPILQLQPFIVIGPTHSLDLLHALGYITFEKYINEEYDSIDDDELRMQAIFRLAYQLSNIPIDTHKTMLSNIHSILEHNQQNLIDSKKFRLINLLNELNVSN